MTHSAKSGILVELAEWTATYFSNIPQDNWGVGSSPAICFFAPPLEKIVFHANHSNSIFHKEISFLDKIFIPGPGYHYSFFLCAQTQTSLDDKILILKVFTG